MKRLWVGMVFVAVVFAFLLISMELAFADLTTVDQIGTSVFYTSNDSLSGKKIDIYITPSDNDPAAAIGIRVINKKMSIFITGGPNAYFGMFNIRILYKFDNNEVNHFISDAPAGNMVSVPISDFRIFYDGLLNSKRLIVRIIDFQENGHDYMFTLKNYSILLKKYIH